MVSESVDAAIDDGLDPGVSFGRDDGGDVPGFKVGKDKVGVVPLSASRTQGLGPGWSITGA